MLILFRFTQFSKELSNTRKNKKSTKMLNKRQEPSKSTNLVNYSDSDTELSSSGDENITFKHQKRLKTTNPKKPTQKPLPTKTAKTAPKAPQRKKKMIQYSLLPLQSNPLHNLNNFLEKDSNLQTLKQERDQKDKLLHKKYNKIQFDSVKGNKTLHLPEAAFSVNRRKTREPFYYRMMKDIYKEDIDKKVKEKEDKEAESNIRQHLTEAEKKALDEEKEVEGVKYKEISQANQVQFDERRYLAMKAKRDLLLSQRVNLNPSKQEMGNNQLNAMAYQQIENEVRMESMGYY